MDGCVGVGSGLLKVAEDEKKTMMRVIEVEMEAVTDHAEYLQQSMLQQIEVKLWMDGWIGGVPCLSNHIHLYVWHCDRAIVSACLGPCTWSSREERP